MSWVPPRRIASTPITVVALDTSTALSRAASDALPNEFTKFHGGDTAYGSYDSDSLNTRITNPYAEVTDNNGNGIFEHHPVDVTQDGQDLDHTLVDWCGKGSYDPTNRRVQWIGHGTGSYVKQWRFNTLPYYDEATDTWAAVRGFRHSDQQANDNALSMTHTYDNNCIDVIGRRIYKKQFLNDNDQFSSGKWFVFNLDDWQFASSLSPASPDAGGTAFGPADFVLTRGAAGRIWYANGNPVRIWEYDVTTGTGQSADWTVVPGTQGAFPLLPANFNPANNGGVMSYNPRAFGGQGGMLIGGGSTTCYTINCTTLQVTAVGAAPFTVWLPAYSRLCKEPPTPGVPNTGMGWLLFLSQSSGGYVWHCDGTQWTQRAATPSNYGGIVIPIDDYGVVWCIAQRPSSSLSTTARAWLYKP